MSKTPQRKSVFKRAKSRHRSAAKTSRIPKADAKLLRKEGAPNMFRLLQNKVTEFSKLRYGDNERMIDNYKEL